MKPDAPITGFAIDSRQLRAGDVFVAVRTERRDGHDFLAAAAGKGAIGALVARQDPESSLPQLVVADPVRAFQAIAREHRLQFSGPVVGVTGSAGKTSTKHLLALLLGPEALATEGNLNNHLGVPLTLTRLDPARHAYAVVEAGISEPGEMAVLARMIEPDVAVVTLIAEAHTQELGGLEGVAREKAVLAAATRQAGTVFVPQSVAEHEVIRELPARKRIVNRVEALPPAGAGETIPFVVRHEPDRTRLEIRVGDEPPFALELPRVSDGMAQNAALAVAVAHVLGVSRDRIQERLETWEPPALRGEVRRLEGQLLYLDCYNANPASMRDALEAFEGIAPRGQPRLYVIGGMEELGEESARHHRDLGRSLRLEPGDHVFVIGSDADAVRAGALESGARPEQVEVSAVLAPVMSRLAGFRGSIFVKGSRKYRLEEILVGTPHAPATLGAH